MKRQEQGQKEPESMAELLDALIQAKQKRRLSLACLSFEEKIVILVRSQEIAQSVKAMTKSKPVRVWQIEK